LSTDLRVAPARSASAIENGAHVGAISKLDATTLQIQAKAALTSLGWKSPIAHAAVAAAVGAMGNDLTLEQLIFEALRRCPAPRA
jgi:Holliday junction resolvasome RuvABC DNA-binding subunit